MYFVHCIESLLFGSNPRPLLATFNTFLNWFEWVKLALKSSTDSVFVHHG